MRKGKMWIWVLTVCFALTACGAVGTNYTPETAQAPTMSSKVELIEGLQVNRPYTTLGLVRVCCYSKTTAQKELETEGKRVGADALIGVRQTDTVGEYTAWAIKYQ